MKFIKCNGRLINIEAIDFVSPPMGGGEINCIVYFRGGGTTQTQMTVESFNELLKKSLPKAIA
jgi:hypothetical protein